MIDKDALLPAREDLSEPDREMLQALSQKELSFVVAYVASPQRNATKAAQAAGYGYGGTSSKNVLAATASRLLKLPRIQAAIDVLERHMMAELAPTAVDTIQRVMSGSWKSKRWWAAFERVLDLVLPRTAPEPIEPKRLKIVYVPVPAPASVTPAPEPKATPAPPPPPPPLTPLPPPPVMPAPPPLPKDYDEFCRQVYAIKGGAELAIRVVRRWAPAVSRLCDITPPDWHAVLIRARQEANLLYGPGSERPKREGSGGLGGTASSPSLSSEARQRGQEVAKLAREIFGRDGPHWNGLDWTND